MKTELSPAIIMRVKEFGESDLLVTFFSADRGHLKGVAKGARKSRHRFVNCLDSLSLINLEYDPKKRGDLCFLHSGKLIEAHAAIRTDYPTLAKAGYMIELVEVLFPPAVKDLAAFELLKESLECLANRQNEESLPFIFEIRIMAIGGYAIHVEKCSICNRAYTGQGPAVFIRERGGIACLKCRQPSTLNPLLNPPSVQMLQNLQVNGFSGLKAISIAEDILKELKPVLKLHREYHLERKLKTAKFIE
ncbi:MAG: DNA repair protein RecO [Desulfobacteraceae bacterium]|nr:MAG: DNA repair protein RecO [Desulfobacteraceae bacterium]